MGRFTKQRYRLLGPYRSHKENFSYHDSFKSLQASISTSSRLGAFFGSAFGGVLLARVGSWRGSVTTVGIAYLIIGCLVYIGLDEEKIRVNVNKDNMSKSIVKSNKTKVASLSNKKNKKSSTQALVKAVSDPKLLLIFIANTLVIPAFDMTAILPTLLSEHVNGLSTELIGTIASLFPLISVPSVLFGAWLEPKLNDSDNVANTNLTSLND